MKHNVIVPPHGRNDRFDSPIARQIWEMKYQFQDPEREINGEIIPAVIHDESVEDTWNRIAVALASVEDKKIRTQMEEKFRWALEDFKYLPAGRITAGAGTARSVTLFNCFVMGTIPDSMAGIFDMLKEAALTMQQGGGIGYDFSTIRPKGTLVKGVGSDASGPLSFMDVWNSMCKTIMSAGSRRGAMMATMDCSHPDIEDFITVKRDSDRLRHFNLSVLITDAFMEAVRLDANWDLVWKGKVVKTVRAMDLWETIMQSTYDFAEPGVIFIDRVNEKNPLRYLEKITCTNPCGEQPLPPYGACLLGSINLARLITNAFQDGAEMDIELMKELVAVAVRMMDNVVDYSNFALEEQKKEAKAKRRIGLGVTGVADALLMLKIKYGTQEAADQVEAWQRAIQNAAYRASVELAKEKGHFPLFDAEKYLASPTVQDLDEDIKADIAIHGIRNALLTSIAPTGTISLYAGNVSSGIEPVFAYAYTRKVLQKDGSRTEEEVIDYAVKLYRDTFGLGPKDALPDYFVSAQTLAPLDHVLMQAAAQKWVDSSISKTINCPEDISFEDFKEVYLEAFRTGCKGCTTYRPNAITGSVLSVEPEKKEEAPEATDVAVIEASADNAVVAAEHGPLIDRPSKLKGETYKLKWPGLAHAFYITINDVEGEDGVRRPLEVFINTQNVEAQAWITALTRMVSAIFRRGGDVSFVAQELSQICDPTGGAWSGGEYVKSLIAAIGGVLKEHQVAIGYTTGTSVPARAAVEAAQVPAQAEQVLPKGKTCPTEGCGATMKMIGGCEQCDSCLYSKCG